MKQIGLAVFAYENIHRKYPSAGFADLGIAAKNLDITNKGDRPSWLVAILPYLDEKASFDAGSKGSVIMPIQ